MKAELVEQEIGDEGDRAAPSCGTGRRPGVWPRSGLPGRSPDGGTLLWLLVALGAVALIVALGFRVRSLSSAQAARSTPVTMVFPADSAPGSTFALRTVEWVIDGDTIVLDGGERGRLVGIDAPESVAPDRPVECFGPEAAQFLTSLLPEGTAVLIAGDTEPVDRYGRSLIYVWTADDGAFVNAEILRAGFADQLSIEPNVEHAGSFRELVSAAQTAGEGLWGACPRE